jgi:hypothetical protein
LAASASWIVGVTMIVNGSVASVGLAVGAEWLRG